MPFGPGFQSILSASRPWIAAQVELAITATPPSGLNFEPSPVVGMTSTRSTPGTLRAAALLTFLIVPPTTGGRAITAYFMPGRRTSAP